MVAPINPSSLVRDAASSPSLPLSIIPNCPKLIGRDELLEKLREAFRKGGTMASLVGIGGAGKTHCAKYFAREWWEQSASERFVCWLSATSEDTIRRHYQDVLKRFQSSREDQKWNMSTGALAALLWSQLDKVSSGSEWLLVFGDVSGELEDPCKFVGVFLPTHEGSWGRGRILLTSRNQAYKGKLPIGYVSQIKVKTLEEDPALAIFFEAIGESPDGDAEVARDLVCVQLAGLPLAIESAASEIVNRGISVAKYIEEVSLSSVYDKVDTVLRSSLIRARNEYGLGELLDIVAFVNPDRIQQELLGTDCLSIGKLCNLCILHRVMEGVYSVHKVCQQVARRGRPITPALSSVEYLLSGFDLQNAATWPLALASVSHVEASLSAVSEGEDSIKTKLASLLLKSGDVL